MENWLQDQGTNAIWTEGFGTWIFGSKDDLGSRNSLFYSHDFVAGPQLAKNWEYDDGRPIEFDNIFVHSLAESGFYNTTVVNPLKLNVTLKGKLKVAFSSVAGTYIRGSKAEYENWLQDPGTNAIWYDRWGNWIFGSQDHLGSRGGREKTWFTSTHDLGVAGPQLATKWEYIDGKKIDSDDISVDSLDESGTYHIVASRSTSRLVAPHVTN